jgi:hypothetical protein
MVRASAAQTLLAKRPPPALSQAAADRVGALRQAPGQEQHPAGNRQVSARGCGVPAPHEGASAPPAPNPACVTIPGAPGAPRRAAPPPRVGADRARGAAQVLDGKDVDGDESFEMNMEDVFNVFERSSAPPSSTSLRRA